jgi:hypothetical protein
MKKTTRKRLLQLSAALLIIALAAVFLIPPIRVALMGLLRGEAFFEGKPTSYWRQQWIREQGNERKPSYFDKILGVFGVQSAEADYIPAATSAEAIPVLRELLKDGDLNVRTYAADYLVWHGNRSQEVADVVFEALRDGGPNSRHVAAGLLRHLGRDRDAVPILIMNIERYPAESLGFIDALECTDPEEARAAVPALNRLLDRKTGMIRVAAARLLCALEPEHEEAQNILVATLEGDEYTRGYFFWFLRTYSMPSSPVLRKRFQEAAAKLNEKDREALERILQP